MNSERSCNFILSVTKYWKLSIENIKKYFIPHVVGHYKISYRRQLLENTMEFHENIPVLEPHF